MTLTFPQDFIFGTSTSAYQIESPYSHNWEGIRAKDGSVFVRTTDHEKQRSSDATIISSLAPHYRMSLMWSRLQRSPYAPFDEATKEEYHTFLKELRKNGTSVMMVLYHWADPIWFQDKGGWTNAKNIDLFVDFAKKLVDEFGEYVSYWNTLNEPNLYATLSFLVGEFPPYQKNIFTAIKVLRNMSRAHSIIYKYLKNRFPDEAVGVSINCASFFHENLPGKIAASIARQWYREYIPGLFTDVDFVGISYYAKVSFDPYPITYLTTPQKITSLKRRHDDMWEYYPEGLAEHVKYFSDKYKKPVIVTENGFCTGDDTLRVEAIRDYMKIIHGLLQEGVDLRGYYHWSSWDNFEWNLGTTYQFGLYECDFANMTRRKKGSADVYSRLAYDRVIDVH